MSFRGPPTGCQALTITMLPPQTRSGLSTARFRSTSFGQPGMMQVRHLWPFCRRNPIDWASHLDPQYQRFQRHRHINTRAKLLKTLRRRSKWDWDAGQRPFFSPKHIRLASHWHGNNGNWYKPRANKAGQPDSGEAEAGTNEEGDGYELSARERAWKEQMERMRQRIAQDPYEAIFGKRFEPFWGSLVPSWMREEIGLPSASQKTADPKTDETRNFAKVAPVSAKQTAAASKTETPAASYAYSSSTSWDSWTNKARKAEWDSVSGETKHYEYDPISHRMVLISGPQRPQQTALTQAKPAELQPIPEAPTSIEKQAVSDPRYDVDGLTATSIRASMGKYRPAQAFAQKGAQPIESTFSSAADLNDHAEQVSSLERKLESVKARRIKLTKEQPNVFRFGNLSQKYLQLEQDIQAAIRRLQNLDCDRANGAADRALSFVKPESSSKEGLTEPIASDESPMGAIPQARQPETMQTSLQRGPHAPKCIAEAPIRPALERMQSKASPQVLDQDDSAAHESTEAFPRSVPKAWAEQADLLQAHRVTRTTAKVPFTHGAPSPIADMEARQAAYEAAQATARQSDAERERAAKAAKANELLTAEIAEQKLAMKLHEERYADKLRSLRGELSTAYEQSSLHADEFRKQAKKTEEMNGPHDEKLKQVEAKHKAKVAALREELDIAYRQSAVHADEFREQRRKADETNARKRDDLEVKYKAKLAELKKEVNVAYQQSSMNADEFQDRIRKLEVKLAKGQSTVGEKQAAEPAAAKPHPVGEMRGEGDFCSNVTKYAGSSRWYKRPCSPPTIHPRDGQNDSEEALVKEVRDIYERAYGIIGQEHKQPKVAAEDVSSVDLRLGSTLGKYEKKRAYEFSEDGLEEQIAGEKAPANTVSKGERKNAYKFRIDDLVAGLEEPAREQRATHEKRDAYVFRKDNLEAELQETEEEPLVRDEKTGVYRFREDGLEAELVGKTEEELDSVDAAGWDKQSYGFKDDNLEAEMTRRSREEPEPAELTGWDEKSYGFQRDNLEAEIAGRAKHQMSDAQRSRRQAEDRERLRQRFAAEISGASSVEDGGFGTDGFAMHSPPSSSSERLPSSPTSVNTIDGTAAGGGQPATGNYASPTGFVNYDPILPQHQARDTDAKRAMESAWSAGKGTISRKLPPRSAMQQQRRQRQWQQRQELPQGLASLMRSLAMTETQISRDLGYDREYRPQRAPSYLEPYMDRSDGSGPIDVQAAQRSRTGKIGEEATKQMKEDRFGVQLREVPRKVKASQPYFEELGRKYERSQLETREFERSPSDNGFNSTEGTVKIGPNSRGEGTGASEETVPWVERPLPPKLTMLIFGLALLGLVYLQGAGLEKQERSKRSGYAEMGGDGGAVAALQDTRQSGSEGGNKSAGLFWK